MLQYKLTKYHAGIELWGDYTSLEALHEFIHSVVDESCYIENKEGFVLSLAYDLRKAYEGQRNKGYRDHFGKDRCTIYGVEVLWPILLLQVSVLRHAMSFIPTNKREQSLMFELEYIVESALRDAIPITADALIRRMSSIGSDLYSHIEMILDSRCLYFIELPPKQRLIQLPRVMESFSYCYDIIFKGIIGKKDELIPPDAFANTEKEWPDFKW